jgi:biopolymer transport protein ExbD
MSNPLRLPRRRRFVFMLTPLVDVMFLLLIFFMLSSQTAPYSLLQILAAASPNAPVGTPAPPPAAVAAPGRGDLVVSIGRGFVRFNGERVELSDVKAALERFKAAGFASAVVLPARTSTVQDVVSVLEAFQATAFGDTKLMTPEPGG